MMRGVLSPFTCGPLSASPFRRTAVSLIAASPMSPGIVSSADPDLMEHATATGGQIWNYFIDFDGTSTRGRVKRIASTDGGATWSAATSTLDRSGEATFYNLETPSVLYRESDGAYLLYGLAYTTSNTDAANKIFMAYGDPAAWTWAGAGGGIGVDAGAEGTYDTLYIMEPDVVEISGAVHMLYHGTADSVGGSILHCHDTPTKDGYTFVDHAAVFRAGTDAPSGAFYHGAASPSLIKVGSEWIMAFTGLTSGVANAGGIGLARSSAATPASGWSFGPNVVLEPYSIGGTEVTQVTGAALRYDAATGMLGIWHSAVVGSAIQMGYAEIPLAAALIKAGI